MTRITGTILRCIQLDAVNRGRVPCRQGVIIGNEVLGTGRSCQHRLKITEGGHTILFRGSMADQIIFIGVGWAAIDISTDFEGEQRIRRKNNRGLLAGLFEIQRNVAICTVEIFVGMTDRTGESPSLMGVVHGDFGEAGLAGIGMTLGTADGFDRIITVNALRLGIVELTGLMTSNTAHLSLFIMDIGGGAQFTHIFTGEAGTMAGITCFVHRRSFHELVTVEQAAFCDGGPSNMTTAASGMTVCTVKPPGCRQQGISHFMRFDYSGDNVRNPVQPVVHGILVRSGNTAMTLPADPTSIFFRRILDHALMGLILVVDIRSLVTVDTTYFAVH